MTVGENLEGGRYGWEINQSESFGNITPSLNIPYEYAIISYNSVINDLVVGAVVSRSETLFGNSMIVMSINGAEYSLTYSESEIIHHIALLENPFPPVGETCSIKLVYTLA